MSSAPISSSAASAGMNSSNDSSVLPTIQRGTSFFCYTSRWCSFLLQICSHPPPSVLLITVCSSHSRSAIPSLLRWSWFHSPLHSTYSIPEYSHCFSLTFLQFFCISWDEWQARATKNPKCGRAIDLYSSIIMFWFILYFLPNTSSCLIFFLLTAETDFRSSTLFLSVKGQPIILYTKWCI